MKKILPILMSCLLTGCFVCKKTAPVEAPAEIIAQQITEETKKPKAKEALVFDSEKSAQFEFDSVELTAEGKTHLADIAEELRKYPDAVFTIVGHTDATGRESYNSTLALLRAEAAKQLLQNKYGINNRIETAGKGPSEPKYDNNTLEGRRANRRVEIFAADR